MAAPELVPVPEDLLPLAARRAAVPPGARWFRVVRGGTGAGRLLRAGDLLACAGRAGLGDTVVLVPAGRGAPRLGAVHRDGLRGEAGEPCDPKRWSPAGRLCAVVAGVPVRPQAPAPVLTFRRPPPPAQLRLFEGAA